MNKGNRTSRQKENEEDRALVELTKQGNTRAFGKLYTKYYHLVLTCVLKILHDLQLSEDTLQDTFFKAFHSLKSRFDGRNFRAWVMCIAKHTAINARRKHTRHTMVDPEEVLSAEQLQTFPNQERVIAQRELREILGRALTQLPDARQEVIVSVDVEDMSYQEAADTTRAKLGTIMSRLFRARNQLREVVEDTIDPEELGI